MAVVEIATNRMYTGLSSDSKPTGVPPGTLFFESDSGCLWITDDNGANWVLRNIGYANLADIAQVLKHALLQALNRQVALDATTGRRLNVNVEAGTVTTVTSVTAVATLNQLGGQPIRDVQITPAERANWQLSVRARIA